MIIALAIAAACSGDCRAESSFAAMERRLLSGLLQLQVTSHAEGAVRADATTEVSIGPAVRLHARGTFDGKPFAHDFDEPSTPALRDAVVLGMTRNGLLHNLSNLAQGNGIDHADGGARDWITAEKFRRVKGGVSYVILLGGKDFGFATLLIDAKTKLPRKRTQVVHFPDGDMRVTETYRFPAKR
jgi:hypothetical protein